MPLILAIEPDHRQASQLRAMARGRLGADLVHAESAGPALIALGGRVPDLILVPALLSPADEAAIGDHLRVLDAASSHVQTLITPLLAANRPRSRRRGVLASLKRQEASAPEGCDPGEFAEQCATYLQRAAAERERRAEAEAQADADAAADALVVEPVIESLEAPDLALMEFAAEPQAERVIEALPLVVEPPAEPAVELFIEAAVEDQEDQVEPAVQALAALAVEEPLTCAAEPAADEDAVFEIVAPARELEFIELDLSTLVEELSGPNLAIPIDAPVRTAAIEDAVTLAPAPLAARETPPVTPPANVGETVAEPVAVERVAVEPVAVELVAAEPVAAEPVAAEPVAAEPVAAEPVAPLRVPVKWTAVYSLPGRLWPSMEGVTAEAESTASQAAPSAHAAMQAVGLRTPAPKAIQDEWGFFDPTRCGFTALLSKLDEITNADETPLKQRA
jgi:hypothetical protein